MAKKKAAKKKPAKKKPAKKKARRGQDAPPATLFKYRRFDRFTADIFENRRLFLARWDKMNDPMEGLFRASGSTVDRVVNEKRQYLILSLSESCRNPAMWTHYGDEHCGFCVEVKVLDNTLKPIQYTYEVPDGHNQSAETILLRKHTDWEYEKEWRVLARKNPGLANQFVDVEIKSVVLGLGAYRGLADAIPDGIKVFRMTVDGFSEGPGTGTTGLECLR